MSKFFKLQEFVAHSEDINCLKFGRKSGQVMVTGGDDRNVNMWRVGKPNNLMSLSGHQSPVECVTFDSKEEKVVAGSKGGSIKCFDLHEGKVYRTLTGHRSTCSCVDYHPYGQFIASGSFDTNLKIWDARTKTCIQTYKGHTNEINQVQFSPDGRWVASGGRDGSLKLWDLTAGKLLKDFTDFNGGITCIDFNPCEFIISAGSEDKCVRVYDLESFNLIAATPSDYTRIRHISHSTDGQYILSSTKDMVKVWSFDSAIQCYDSVDVQWNRVKDTALCTNNGNTQLVGGSINSTFLSIWVIELGKLRPFNGEDDIKKKDDVPEQYSPTNDSQNEELSRQEEKIDSKEKGLPSPLPPPVNIIRPAEVQQQYPSSNSSLEPPNKYAPTRPSSREAKSHGRLRTPPSVKLAVNNVVHDNPVEKKQEGLNFADFVPESSPETHVQQKVYSAKDLIRQLDDGRGIFNKALSSRLENLSIVGSFWSDGDIKGAIRHIHHQHDRMRQMTSADVLASIEWKNNPLNLETCSMLLPLASELLSSNFESYISTGLISCTNLFSGFSHIVKTTMDAAKQNNGSRIIDISREDRLRRCEKCYQEFVNLNKQVEHLLNVNKHVNLDTLIQNLNSMLKTFLFCNY